MKDVLDTLALRYERALHAMQSGVAADHASRTEHDGTPKHLRVGINSALSDQSALAKLLIEKGVISELEYYKAITEAMEREVAAYEEKLSSRHGHKITLA